MSHLKEAVEQFWRIDNRSHVLDKQYSISEELSELFGVESFSEFAFGIFFVAFFFLVLALAI